MKVIENHRLKLHAGRGVRYFDPKKSQDSFIAPMGVLGSVGHKECGSIGRLASRLDFRSSESTEVS